MSGVNLPLMFGAVVAGAVVIDYGLKSTKAALASSQNTGGATSATVASGAKGSAAQAESLAQSLAGSPYSVAGHATAITETIAQVKQVGTDCSGFVSDLMGPNGLGLWSSAYATPGIPTAPSIVPGKGSQITLWNNPNPGSAGHVWIEFDLGGVVRYFEDAGGIGAHEMSASEAQMYLSSGQYEPFHPRGY